MPSVTRIVRAPGQTWQNAISGADPDADWLWLLEPDVDPAPDALERLLEPLADLGDLPVPALLASRVVRPDGHLHPAHEPWIPLLDRVVVIAAAQRRLTSLRLARWGSLLVSRAAVAEHGPPRADFAGGADDLEWTARLLKEGEGHGYLVPTSTATSSRPARPRFSGAQARTRARMVRGEGWVGQEPVWFAFMLGVDAARALALRARPEPA